MHAHIQNLNLLKVGGIREDPDALIGVVPLWAFLFPGGHIMPSNTNGVNATPSFRNSIELCEALLYKNNSFRALGELLSSASLSAFDSEGWESSGKEKAEQRQSGLGQLFELIIDDQERAIELFMEEYFDSDEHLLKAAAGKLNLAKQGAFIGGRIPERDFKEAIEGLHTVISRNNGLRPIAEAMIEALDQYAPLSVRKVAKAANGGE